MGVDGSPKCVLCGRGRADTVHALGCCDHAWMRSEERIFKATVAHHVYGAATGTLPSTPRLLFDALAVWCTSLSLGAGAVGVVEGSLVLGAAPHTVRFEEDDGLVAREGWRRVLSIPATRLQGADGPSWWTLSLASGTVYVDLAVAARLALSVILERHVLGGAVGIVLRWGTRLLSLETICSQEALDWVDRVGLLPPQDFERCRGETIPTGWLSWVGVLPRTIHPAMKAGLERFSVLRRAAWVTDLICLLVRGADTLVAAYLSLTRQALRRRGDYFPTWRVHKVVFPPSRAVMGALTLWKRRPFYMDDVKFDDWLSWQPAVAVLPPAVDQARRDGSE